MLMEKGSDTKKDSQVRPDARVREVQVGRAVRRVMFLERVFEIWRWIRPTASQTQVNGGQRA